MLFSTSEIYSYFSKLNSYLTMAGKISSANFQESSNSLNSTFFPLTCWTHNYALSTLIVFYFVIFSHRWFNKFLVNYKAIYSIPLIFRPEVFILITLSLSIHWIWLPCELYVEQNPGIRLTLPFSKIYICH